MSKSTLTIFGCDHRFQRNLKPFSKTDEYIKHLDQQKKFMQTLAKIMVTEEITFVGEEIVFHEMTLVQTLAYGLACPYFNIEMPTGQRIRKGCKPDLEVDLFVEEFIFGNITQQEAKEKAQEKVLECYEIREKYMADRICEIAKENDDNGLVVCGNNHAEKLKQLCEERFGEIKIISLMEQNWFDKALYGNQ